MTNGSSEILILNLKEALGILDLRSLGYYNIKQGVLQQKVCAQFNNLINTIKKEQILET